MLHLNHFILNQENIVLIHCFILDCISTEPLQLNEYTVEIEISTVDSEVLQQLRVILDNSSLPIRVSDSINITELNIIGKNILFNVAIKGS